MKRGANQLVAAAAAIDAGSYILALVFFETSVRSASPHPWFAGTYLGSIAGSAALSLLSFLLGQAWIAVFIAGLRCYLILVLGYGIGAYISAKLILGVGLMVEVCALVAFPANLIACAVFIAALTSAQVFPFFLGQSQLVETVSFPTPDEAITLAVFLTAAAGTSAYIRRLLSEKTSLAESLRLQELNVDTLAELNKNLQDYAHTADEDSAERERNRISREIHDISGYIFTNLIALMDAAGSMPEKNSHVLTDLISTARKQAQEGLQETRAALRKLRNEGPRKTDNALAIHKVVSIFRAVAGIDVDLDLGNLPRFLSPDLNRALYRTVQEGLTNAVRHGKATKARINFWVWDGIMLLSISDNGSGSASFVKGIGLSGMEERVGALGGSVSTGASLEGGFKLSVSIPVEEKGHD